MSEFQTKSFDAFLKEHKSQQGAVMFKEKYYKKEWGMTIAKWFWDQSANWTRDLMTKELELVGNDRHLLDEANIDLNYKVIALEKNLALAVSALERVVNGDVCDHRYCICHVEAKEVLSKINQTEGNSYERCVQCGDELIPVEDCFYIEHIQQELKHWRDVVVMQAAQGDISCRKAIAIFNKPKGDSDEKG